MECACEHEADRAGWVHALLYTCMYLCVHKHIYTHTIYTRIKVMECACEHEADRVGWVHALLAAAALARHRSPAIDSGGNGGNFGGKSDDFGGREARASALLAGNSMVLPPTALLHWSNFGGKLDFGGNRHHHVADGGVSIVNMMHREVFACENTAVRVELFRAFGLDQPLKVHSYLHLYLSICIYLYIYLSICTYTYICLCIYVYIYVYVHIKVTCSTVEGLYLWITIHICI